MSLYGNDGSDMELDSDTSPERYYDLSTTYNQCSKLSNSPNTDENKDGLKKSLNSDKKNVSTPHSPQSENDPLKSSNSGSDHKNEFGIKSPTNSMTASSIYYAPPQSTPQFNFQGPQLLPWKNNINNITRPLSLTSIPEITSHQATLASDPTSQSQQPTNGFPLKSSVAKSLTNNVSNEPTILEKHDKIKFEIKKRLGSKNKLFPQISVKTSAKKNISGVINNNNNADMMNVYDTTLDKESINSTLVDKSLSLSASTLNSFHEKDKSKSNNGDKRVIDNNSKGIVGDHVTEEKEKKSNKQIVIENSSVTAEVNSVIIGKVPKQQQIHICEENSIVIGKKPVRHDQQEDQVVDNNTTRLTAEISEKNSDQRVVIDSNFIVTTEKDQIMTDDKVEDSVILKKGQDQDQEKNQIDNDNSQVQEKNLEIVQKEQVEYVKEGHQNTEIQLENIDNIKVVNKSLETIQDVNGSAADIINNNIQAMDIDNDDNDDNKDTEYPSLSTINTEEDKSDLMELDQINILPDQDHKDNDENIIPKTDIIKKSEGASSEKNEVKKSDKSETNDIHISSKNKDKGKKVAISVSKVVKPTNQAVASSSKTVETEMTSQVVDTTSHIDDHLTNLMTQFTNKINQANQSQSSQIQQIQQPIIQPTGQIVQQTTHTKQIIQPISNATESNQMQLTQSTSQVSQPVKRVEETINTTDLSNDIIEKYNKLDAILFEFDEVAKKAVNAYDELHRLLPEGTVIRIDPPTTYKWDIITSMFGVTDMSRLERYTLLEDDNGNKGISNPDGKRADVRYAREEETLSETEFDDEDIDVPSDDPDDKNFKCRSTILKQPNPKRWHNTRSNRPPSANLRQRTKVDLDSSNISTTSTTSNSSSKKKQSQTTSKRTLRTRKGEDEEDDDTTIPNSQKRLDLDKYYEDGKPRRPANGFSFFCGDICAKVRNEKLPISGTIAYAAEIWKKMTEEEKKPWLDRGAKSKSEYQELLNKWKEEQEELKNSSIRKRTLSPKVKNGSSSKKPRND